VIFSSSGVNESRSSTMPELLPSTSRRPNHLPVTISTRYIGCHKISSAAPLNGHSLVKQKREHVDLTSGGDAIEESTLCSNESVDSNNNK
jgi:hypothetical protein